MLPVIYAARRIRQAAFGVNRRALDLIYPALLVNDAIHRVNQPVFRFTDGPAGVINPVLNGFCARDGNTWDIIPS